MIRVAIETSGRVGSVAVGRDDRVLAAVELREQTRHAAELIPALDSALSSAGVDRSAIGAVVVGAGPGSFTGVRVAGATAKGLTIALDVPLLAYSSLLALAVDATGEAPDAVGADAADGTAAGVPICGLFDARRDELYGGCWVVGSDRLVELMAPRVGGVEAMVDDVGRALREGEAAAGVVYVGAGMERYREELLAASAKVALGASTGPEGARARATGLLWLAHHHGAAGRVRDRAAWEPLYVRGSSAERGLRG